MVYIEALKHELGCVVMQESCVVAYICHQLKDHKNNYHTYDLELATIVFTLKICKHYLYGEAYKIYSDNKNLYLFD